MCPSVRRSADVGSPFVIAKMAGRGYNGGERILASTAATERPNQQLRLLDPEGKQEFLPHTTHPLN